MPRSPTKLGGDVKPALRIARSLAWIAAFLAAWELIVRALGIPEYALPAPSAIGADFLKRHVRILSHAGTTIGEILGGFAIAIAVSVPLAAGIAFVPFVERRVYPAIVMFQVVPKIALAPIFVLWFGIGWTSRLLLVFLLCFFPMLVNNVAGLRGANPEIVDFARSTGASAWRLFRRVRLPGALPSVFTGLRIGAVNAVTGAIIAEFVASERGLGYLLQEYQGNLLSGAVFATVLVLSLVGLALYHAVELVERLAIPWHVSQRADPRLSSVT